MQTSVGTANASAEEMQMNPVQETAPAVPTSSTRPIQSRCFLTRRCRAAPAAPPTRTPPARSRCDRALPALPPGRLGCEVTGHDRAVGDHLVGHFAKAVGCDLRAAPVRNTKAARAADQAIATTRRYITSVRNTYLRPRMTGSPRCRIG